MYGKLFVSMFDGTLGTRGPWQALVTFQQLVILADRQGIVDMTADAISRRTTIPLAIIQQGISELEKPDPESRSPAEEGARIVLLDENRPWGWQIVNYAHYRELRTADDRREYMRQYQRKRRADVNNVNNVNNVEKYGYIRDREPKPPPSATDTHAKKPTKQKKNKTEIPVDFAVSEKVSNWYREKGYSENITDHLESFVIKCNAKGYTYINWDAALMTAIKEDWGKVRETHELKKPILDFSFDDVEF